MKTKTKLSEAETDALLAIDLLENTGLSLAEAAQLVKDILDAKPKKLKLANRDYCNRIISIGAKNLPQKDMTIGKGLELYLKDKADLKASSFRDIKYLSRRFFSVCLDLLEQNFSDISADDCKKHLSQAFKTVAQFNKGRTFLSGFMNYAITKKWIDRNIIIQIKRQS